MPFASHFRSERSFAFAKRRPSLRERHRRLSTRRVRCPRVRSAVKGSSLWKTSFHSAAVSVESDLTAEFSSDYSEFVVDLKAPYGIAFAPDLLGQIFVAKVEPGSSAEKQQVMVGDIFKQCTCALQPGEVCSYTDLRKIHWAISKNRDLLRLVLKRQQSIGRVKWHRCGVCGCSSGYSSWLLTPLHFPCSSRVEWSNRREGKVMVTAFRKTVIEEVKHPFLVPDLKWMQDGSSEEARRNAARSAKAVDLKSKLLDALQLPTLVLPKYSLMDPSSVDEGNEDVCYVDILEEDSLSSFEQNRVEEQLNSKKVRTTSISSVWKNSEFVFLVDSNSALASSDYRAFGSARYSGTGQPMRTAVSAGASPSSVWRWGCAGWHSLSEK